jgi:hypothetical protein
MTRFQKLTGCLVNLVSVTCVDPVRRNHIPWIERTASEPRQA